jgi:hypothetical protein
MKKLLLTSALIGLGSLSVVGTANSQTTITGELKGAYKNVEGFGAGAKTLSGFTSERQINFAHAATLNNGLKFTAGFSCEQDGNEDGKGTHTTGSNASLNSAIDCTENNWINFTSGSTTFEIGMDHIQNSDRNLQSRVGLPISEVVGSWAVATTRGGTNNAAPAGLQYSQGDFTNKAKMGFGIVQNVGTGNASFNFIPRTDDSANVADTNVPTGSGKSAYELTYFGAVPGVKGLTTNLGYNVAEKNGADLQDAKLKLYNLSYAFDNFAVGIEKRDAELATKVEQDSIEYSLSYKISPLVSVGIGMIETEGKDANGVKRTSDEKINYVQVGYNLGAIYTTLNYVDAENIGYVATQDGKAWIANFGVKF